MRLTALSSNIKTNGAILFNSKKYDPYNSIVPIFIETKIPKRIIQIGTGVFIDFHDTPFLITAAHVTDELKNGELLVPTRDGLSPIEGYMAHIDLPPDIPRSDDNIDIAYYRLSSNFVALMCHEFWPLPPTKIELITSAQELSTCSIVGFPSSKSKKNNDGVHTSNIFTYRGVRASEKEYKDHNLNPEQSILINFNRKNSISIESKNKILPPIPKGVSGGAIFAWPYGDEISEDWNIPKLVGIFHTYKQKNKLMIGTSLISFVAAMTLGEMKNYDGVC
jgi:hypothetical protein